MNNERDPERCLGCLKAVMGNEDMIDLFTTTYEHLMSTCSESLLREMRELLIEQTVYVHGLLVDRTEAGLIQGANN